MTPVSLFQAEPYQTLAHEERSSRKSDSTLIERWTRITEMRTTTRTSWS